MNNMQRFIISRSDTGRQALQRLNEIAIAGAALFVTDENNRLAGSLTDGDIRRGLLKGLNIDSSVHEFLNAGSKYFTEGENNFERIGAYRKLKIRFVPVIDKDHKIIRIIDIDSLRSLVPADAVLMAGGKGERLKPLTDKVPKPMLNVGDKPIIIRNMERLADYGVSNFYVSVRHMAGQVEEGINAHKLENASVRFIREDVPLGTIGAVKLIPHFENDVVLLMNADLLTNIDFSDFYSKFVRSGADMQVATVPYKVDVPYAVLDINHDEEVVSFREKPSYTYYSNAGIYLFKKELVELIPGNQAFDATHFMEAVIAKKKRVVSYPILGYWLDIGRLEDYHKAQEDVKHIPF